MIEGVHFDHRLHPSDVGWKLVAVNVSDIAAMGCLPDWALLTIAIPEPVDLNFVEQFSAGLHAALKQWNVRLVGGDTTRSPGPKALSLTLASAPRNHPPLTRCGANHGDEVWVTGTLGDAAAGFLHNNPMGLKWLRRPVPPIEFAQALPGLATAAMDISDGLATDMPRLCKASGVGACINPHALPRSKALEEMADPISLQMAFGEDYQLLFCANPMQHNSIKAAGNHFNTRVTCIGKITQDEQLTLSSGPWPTPLFSHFQHANDRGDVDP